MSTRLFAAVLVVLAGCSTPDPQPPVPTTRAALVGTWSHELSNGEWYELVLFESGIAGFIHAGETLPISQAYGRWSFDDGTLALDIVGGEPPHARFPLANRLLAARDHGTLTLDRAGTRTSWTAKDRYGTVAGAAERAATDERSWTGRVEAAEQAAAGAP